MEMEELDDIEWLLVVLPSDFVEVLAVLPRLGSLAISYDSGEYLQSHSDALSPPSFLTLRNLTLESMSGFSSPARETDDFATCTHFLHKYRPPRLERLALVDVQVAHLDTLHAFCSATQTLISSTLTHLFLDLGDEETRVTGAITLHTLGPLCGLRHLQMFSLVMLVSDDSTGLHFALADDALGALASAWPALRSFELYGPWRVLPTYNALILFAARCPRIQRIRLTFNGAAGGADADGRAGRAVHNASLTELDVGASPVGQAHVMAAVLSSLFPSLKSVKAIWGLSQGSAWKQVNELLLAQQRRWTEADNEQ